MVAHHDYDDRAGVLAGPARQIWARQHCLYVRDTGVRSSETLWETTDQELNVDRGQYERLIALNGTSILGQSDRLTETLPGVDAFESRFGQAHERFT